MMLYLSLPALVTNHALRLIISFLVQRAVVTAVRLSCNPAVTMKAYLIGYESLVHNARLHHRSGICKCSLKVIRPASMHMSLHHHMSHAVHHGSGLYGTLQDTGRPMHMNTVDKRSYSDLHNIARPCERRDSCN